jgi:hypothetical protein
MPSTSGGRPLAKRAIAAAHQAAFQHHDHAGRIDAGAEHAFAVLPAARQAKAAHALHIVRAQGGKDLVAPRGEIDRRAGFGVGAEGIGTEYGKLVWHGGRLAVRTMRPILNHSPARPLFLR